MKIPIVMNNLFQHLICTVILIAITMFNVTSSVNAQRFPEATAEKDASTLSRPDVADFLRCSGKLFFDGECREPTFFKQFVSEGAELRAIYGSPSAGFDPGVLLIQAYKDTVETIGVLPEQPTFQRSDSYYINGYEVDMVYAVSWLADGGRRYTLKSLQSRKLSGFGTTWWHYRTDEPGSYVEASSDFCDDQGSCYTNRFDESGGTARLSCDAQASIAGSITAISVGLGGIATSLNAGAVTGLLAGFIFGPGVAGPAGVAVTGSGATMTGITAVAIGNVTGTLVKEFCVEPTTSQLNNIPVVTAIMVPGTDSSGTPNVCGEGTERYSGIVKDCSTVFVSGGKINSDNDVTTTGEEIKRCVAVRVVNACVVFLK